MFIGEYKFNIDDHHRLNIPKSFKGKMENDLVIMKGFEKCLYLYNKNDFETITNKINELSFTRAKNRIFSRSLTSGAFEETLDSKGRICISQVLLDYASLKKECVIIGVSNRIEIWDRNIWDQYSKENAGMLQELGEELDL